MDLEPWAPNPWSGLFHYAPLLAREGRHRLGTLHHHSLFSFHLAPCQGPPASGILFASRWREERGGRRATHRATFCWMGGTVSSNVLELDPDCHRPSWWTRSNLTEKEHESLLWAQLAHEKRLQGEGRERWGQTKACSKEHRPTHQTDPNCTLRPRMKIINRARGLFSLWSASLGYFLA